MTRRRTPQHPDAVLVAGVPTYEGRPLDRPDEPVVDQGLAFDLVTLLDRRRALRVLGGGAGALLLAACAPTASDEGTSGADDAATGADGGDCATTPEETAGPFPGDGSNGPDVLAEDGVVRQDITSSVGSMSGSVEGVPCTIELTVQDATDACAPLAGAAVYAWHCDALGRYSLYSDGVTDQNWLRGVQEADADGTVRFTTILPGCYPGRWPHVHLEVFPTLAAATDPSGAVATSQLAFPRDVSEQAYATPGYDGSTANLAALSLETDGVFREDGGVRQLASVTGSVEEGFVARLVVTVAT